MTLLDELKRQKARRAKKPAKKKRKASKRRAKKRKTTKRKATKRKATKKTSSAASLRKRLAGYYKRGELGKASKLRARMRKKGMKVK